VLRSFVLVGLWCFAALGYDATVGTQEAPASAAWHLTGSGTTYRLSGGGSPLAGAGADVELGADEASAAEFGAAATALPAAPFVQRHVKLSAVLSTRAAAGRGGALWLRADGPNGVMAFVNSQDQPVVGSASGIRREIELYVPNGATTVIAGILLAGSGQVSASGLRIVADEMPVAPAAASPQRVLEAAIEIVRGHALRASTVDWDTLAADLRARSHSAKIAADAYPAIRALLAALGDHHSFLMEPAQARKWKSEGVAGVPTVVDVLPGGVGRIVLPPFSGTEPQAARTFAADVVDAIAAKAPQVRCGWIVDLRENTGGNMWPMLAGLRPLLGDDRLGGLKGPNEPDTSWKATNLMGVKPHGPRLVDAAVAVLTGPRTASSGEAVAIAFRGRARTRSFGAPTAGLSTANRGFDLPDGSSLFLTTAVDMDRTGRAYGGAVEPDQAVAEGGAQEAVGVATAWLQQASGCAHGE